MDRKNTSPSVIDMKQLVVKREDIQANEICSKCGLKFGNKTILYIHDKIVHCQPKTLSEKTNIVKTSTNLKTVEDSIFKEKPAQEGNTSFKCDICEATFTEKDSLSGHIASVHEGKKPFQCKRACQRCLQLGY